MIQLSNAIADMSVRSSSINSKVQRVPLNPEREFVNSEIRLLRTRRTRTSQLENKTGQCNIRDNFRLYNRFTASFKRF